MAKFDSCLETPLTHWNAVERLDQCLLESRLTWPSIVTLPSSLTLPSHLTWQKNPAVKFPAAKIRVERFPTVRLPAVRLPVVRLPAGEISGHPTSAISQLPSDFPIVFDLLVKKQFYWQGNGCTGQTLNPIEQYG